MGYSRQKILPFFILPPMVFFALIQVGAILLGSIFAHMLLMGSFFLILFVGFFFTFFNILEFSPKFVLFVACFVGIWGYCSMAGIDAPAIEGSHISHFCDSQPYRITGTICAFVRHFPDKAQVVLDHISLIPESIAEDSKNKDSQTKKYGRRRGKSPDGEPVPVKGKILCNIYQVQRFSGLYGDRLEFTGRLKGIRNFQNPGGFDYQQFLRRKNIWGSTYTSKGEFFVSSGFCSGHCSGLSQKVFSAVERQRNQFFFYIQDILGDSSAVPVFAALVTGKNKLIPHKTRDNFSKAGVSHLLAISGLHMSILATVCWWISFLAMSLSNKALISGKARKTAGVFTLFPLMAYTVFAGFSPSTQRAFLMTLVFMVSVLAERDHMPVNTLAFASVIILGLDPSALFSISFQLSFLSVLFIIAGLKIFHQKGWLQGRSRFSLFFINACLISLLAGIGTAPIVIRYFHVFSLIQVLSNVILVPLAGMVCLPLGLLSFVLFVIHPALAQMSTQFCGKLIETSLFLVEYLVKLPFSWTHVFSLSVWEVFLIYCAMGCGFLWVSGVRYKKQLWGFSLCVVMLIVADGIHVYGTYLFPEKMSVTVLDVGQGNAALIRSPSGKKILVDGGGFPNYGKRDTGFDVGRHVLGPYLWGQKIMSLDAVIISHPDGDHINGLVFILENFTVDMVVKNADENQTAAYKSVMELCKKNQIPVVIPGCQNFVHSFSDISLRFFECQGQIKGRGLNDHSLVFQLQYEDFTMLFPGDILERREKHLVQSVGSLLASHLMLCPHHGSKSSSQESFIEKVRPDAVIISCGYANRYGFPHPQILRRYDSRHIRIFRTDSDGAVTVISNDKNYCISSMRSASFTHDFSKSCGPHS